MFLKNITEISCEHLCFVRNNEIIIQDFNYDFKKGQIYCLQGENGSGKTTLLDLITGMFIGEYEGKIYYNHIDIESLDMKKIRLQRISILEQFPQLIDGNIEENIYLTPFHCKYQSQNVFLKKDNENVVYKGNGVSGGEKQKIGLLRALAKESEVLILDEPTSALDQESKQELFKLLYGLKREKIIIFVSHDIDACSIADQIINMN
ncbi:hypothetical protein B5E64_11720 [Drancourtella sp. An12]|nr:hypothetical protein B5E64_11720 [Drancourtella sp. An12]